MSQPEHPNWQPQGPASRCILAGNQMGWLNCTPTSTAMAAQKATRGALRLSGCDVRAQTGDFVGGTTLRQCAGALDRWHVYPEVYDAANVAAPTWLAEKIRSGRGAVIQGNTSATLKTPQRSTGTGVNHAVYVNHVWGGTYGHPQYAAVYDPAADGRTAGWGKAAQGPQTWPWTLVLAFLAALKPRGDDSTIRLGSGKAYCMIFADTEPHVHLYGGAIRSDPFPWNAKGRAGSSNKAREVRIGPSDDYMKVDTLPVGGRFQAFQSKMTGEQKWYGNHDGNRWVRQNGLTG